MKTKLLLLLCFGFVIMAQATTITVKNTQDTGKGSLRDAVSSAKAGDNIRFDPSLISAGSATIRLKSPINIMYGIFMYGLYNSKDTLFISGRDTNYMFKISMQSSAAYYHVTMDSLVFIHGKGTTGGAIWVDNAFAGTNGYLYLKNCMFRNNSGTAGGAIGCSRFNNGSSTDISFYLNVFNTTFKYNKSSGSGGAICANIEANGSGTNRDAPINMIFRNCNFLNNTASTDGGAIFAKAYTWSTSTKTGKVDITINSTTISKNESGGYGGGVFAYANSYSTSTYPSKNIINCSTSTISENTAISSGGGFFMFSSSECRLNTNFVTIYKNTCLNDGSAAYVSSTATYSASYSVANIKAGHTIFMANGGNSAYNNTVYINSPVNKDFVSYYSYNIYDVPKTHFASYKDPFSVNKDMFSKTNSEVKLSKLTLNSRNTFSLLPDSASIAINAGDISTNDSAQNGPIKGVRDIGASETQYCSPDYKNFTATICDGNSYTFAGKNYSKTGKYYDTILRSGKCDSINILNLTVNPILTPEVSITSTYSGTIMSGANVIFNASIKGGGSSPAYKWYINNVEVGTNASSFSTTSLADKDKVHCVLTSSYSCNSKAKDTSNELIFSVHSNNNEPCNAIDLKISNNCKIDIFSNAGATKTTGPGNPSCAASSTNDVWFKFVAPLSGKVNFASYSGELSDAVLTLYSGNCNSLVELGCADDVSGNKMPDAYLQNANPCETYYLRVSRASGNDGTFGICLIDPNPSVNPVVKNISDSFCIGSNYNFNGKTLSKSGTYYDTIKRSCQKDSVVILTLSSISPVTPDISISSDIGSQFIGGAEVTFSTISGNPGSNPSYKWLVNDIAAGSNNSVFKTTALTNGARIKCVLSSNHSCLTRQNDTSNEIVVTVGDNIDEPCNAKNLSVNKTCDIQTFTNNGARTTSTVGAHSCASTAGNDVWFSFVAPATKNLDIKTYAGQISDATISVYTGNCNTPLELDCADDIGLKKMPELELRNYTPGNTYYIRLSKNTGLNGTFGICLVEVENLNKIEILNSRNIRIYPNPNAGIFMIDCGTNGQKQYSIFDQNGKIIATGNSDNQTISIDLKDCNPGVYYASIMDKNAVSTVKFVVR